MSATGSSVREKSMLRAKISFLRSKTTRFVETKRNKDRVKTMKRVVFKKKRKERAKEENAKGRKKEFEAVTRSTCKPVTTATNVGCF